MQAHFKPLPTTNAPTRQGARPGFTLVELLVVIAIIAVLLGILLPTIGGVRVAARKTSTQSLMRNIRVAIDAFQADNGRLPGYFSAWEMGQESNGGASPRGFTAMENAILELTLPGDIKAVNDPELAAPSDSNFIIDVGPFDDNNLNVRVDALAFGAATDSYLSIGGEHFRAIEGQISTPGEEFEGDRIVNGKVVGVPDIIDYFGQPIMMWSRDTSAALPPAELVTASASDHVFASIYNDDSPPPDGRIASFYWASNAGYLLAGDPNFSSAMAGLTNEFDLGLGEDRIPQSQISMLGGALRTEQPIWVANSLMAILGAPAFPTETQITSGPGGGGPLPLPAAPRGNVVLHSAGPDKVFFGRFAETTSNQSENAVGYRPREDAKAAGANMPSEPGLITVDRFDDLLEATGG